MEEVNRLRCPGCGGAKISRDKEIPIFANCENCGYSWNFFSERLILNPASREIVEEHIKEFFAADDADTRAQWLASLAKIITGPEMKITLQKIGNAVIIQRRHTPTGKEKWNYLLNLNEEN